MPVPSRLLSTIVALLTCVACASPAPTTPTAAPAPPTLQAVPTAAAAPTTVPAVPAPATSVPSKAVISNTVSGEIVVFAASSLTDAFQEIGTAFQQANPAAQVTFNFGSSSQLRTQLEQGARADVFASADQAQMANAKKADTIAGQDRVFARNRLVLIVPRANPAHVTGVKDLANDGLKFVTAQPSVPIGQYTATLLDKASSDPAYGSDFKSRVEGNIVSREDNVRQIVAKVQLGEADAGIVYTTDVTPQVRDQLQQITVPDPLQTIATYPIAVAKGANAAGGEAFVTFVLSPSGQAILGRWGFLRAAGEAAPQAVTAAAKPAASSTTFSGEVRIAGLVGNPRTLTRDDLLALPQETVQVSYLAGQGSESGSFTGTRLLNVLEAAGGAKLPTDMNNAKLRVSIMVTAVDGYQVVFGWGDLDPDYGAMPIMLAIARDGQPLGDNQGMARLVVPGDKRGGRYVSMVKSIELRDPGPAVP